MNNIGICGTNVTFQLGETKFIQSPNFPNLYPVNSKCNWYITSSEPETVVEFKSYNVTTRFYSDYFNVSLTLSICSIIAFCLNIAFKV